MSIAKNAMILSLSIGTWTGHRFDKNATDQVTSSNQAEVDAARVNKHLIPKEDLKAVTAAMGAIRTHFYSSTLPWRDKGGRIITNTAYMDFVQKHAELVDTFMREVDDFIDNKYEAAIEKAGFRMGGLFNRDDYPSKAELRTKFYAEIDVEPIPEAGDFRVEMDEAQTEAIKANIEATYEKRLNLAMQDVWERIAETVGHVAEKLGDPKAIFRDSTFANVEELVGLLPSLNVTGDPDIARIADEVKQKLTGIEPKQVRKDSEFRQEVAQDAKEIMETMSPFLKAFGNS